MNFKEFYNELVVEKYLTYNIPEDKEKLMYDFYTLSYLSQFNLLNNVGAKTSGMGEVMTTATARRPLDTESIDSFSDIKSTLLNYLKDHMSRAVLFAVSAEFRHIFARNSNDKLIDYFKDKHDEEEFIRNYALNYSALNSNFGDFVKLKNKDRYTKYAQDQRGYLDSYKAIKESNISPYKFMKLAEDAFENLTWASSYGGRAWANICKGWLRLHFAKRENELFVAIDHIYDLQHNTDTVFNKLKSYYKNGGYRWIKDALDHKANLKNPYDLLEKSSGTIRILARKILKSEGFESWEGYLRGKGILDKKETKNNSKPFNEWKVGDIIKVADISMNQQSHNWKMHIGANIIILDIIPTHAWHDKTRPMISVIHPTKNEMDVYADRFEWVSSGKKERKTEREDYSTWKVGDTVKKERKTTDKKPFEEWKVGDIVKCIRPDFNKSLRMNKEYKITQTDSVESDDYVHIDIPGTSVFLASRFEWVSSGKKERKTEREDYSTWKIGDIVKCIDNKGYEKTFTVGEKYILKFIDNPQHVEEVFVQIKNDLGNIVMMKAKRFKKETKVADTTSNKKPASGKKERTTSTEDFKVGDVLVIRNQNITSYKNRFFQISEINNDMITLDEISEFGKTIKANYFNSHSIWVKNNFKKLPPDHDFFKI